MVKGTAFVSLISMNDLFFSTRKIAERTGEMMPLYLRGRGCLFHHLLFHLPQRSLDQQTL